MGGADDLRDILDGTTIAVLKQIEGLSYAVIVRFGGRQVTAISRPVYLPSGASPTRA
jgi:hypothetical protein